MSLAHATNIYISPSGSGSINGNGSSQAFEPLERAWDAVRSHVGGSLDQDANVRLAAGIHTLSLPLYLISAGSGRGVFRVK